MQVAAGMTPLALTRPEAAALCGVCPSTFDSWVRKGIIPGPIRGTRRWSRTALTRAVDGTAEPSVSPMATNDNLSPFEIWKRQNARAA